MKEKTTITSVSFDKDSIKIRIGGHTAVIAPDEALSVGLQIMSAYDGWRQVSKSQRYSVLKAENVRVGKTDHGDLALTFLTEKGVPLTIALPHQRIKSLQRSLEAVREL